MKTASFKVTIRLWVDTDKTKIHEYWLQRWETEIFEALKVAGFDPKSVKGILANKKGK